MTKAIFTLIFTLSFCYQIYNKAQSDNKWSWRIFFGTLGGVFAMLFVLILAGAFVVTGPKRGMGFAGLALLVAYINGTIAVCCYSTRAYKRLLKQRGLSI